MHNEIGPLREESYKISLYHRKKDKQGLGQGSQELEDPQLILYYNHDPPSNNQLGLIDFAKDAARASRAFQDSTQNLKLENKYAILLITTRAGVLLSYVEQLMLRYDNVIKLNPPTSTNDDRVTILVDAMTTVATARDHILAANGFIKNFKEEISERERRYLLLLWLAPIIVVYLFLHVYSFILSSQYQIYSEIVFWSLFGAIAKSLLSVSEDVEADVFDPRHLEKYEYKIPVAPFVAGALMAFISLFGITYQSTTIQLDLAKPNFSVIILLSFLFGFLAQRSTELLNDIWVKLFPPSKS